MNKHITPDEYANLSYDDKLGWSPKYLKYKTKKVREYSECEECGQREFMGWVNKTFPIGEPYEYTYHTPTLSEQMTHMAIPSVIDQVNSSSALMDRVLNKETKQWKKN